MNHETKPINMHDETERNLPCLGNFQVGRRTKLTPELQDEFCKLLEAHYSKKAACAALHISQTTFYEWIRKGEAKELRKYTQFLERVNASLAHSQMTLIDKIAKDADWRAAAWLLERLHPKEFGRRQVLAHTTPDDEGPVRVEHSGQAEPVVQIIVQSPDDLWQDSDDLGLREAPELEFTDDADALQMPGDTEL